MLKCHAHVMRITRMVEPSHTFKHDCRLSKQATVFTSCHCRYAEAISGTASSESAQRLPGSEYKNHLHSLWSLLTSVEVNGEPSAGCKAAMIANGNELNNSTVGESTRRSLLEGLFTIRQLLDHAFG